MQIKLFTIPCIGGEKLEAEFNTFLRSQKVLQTESHLVHQNQNCFWCFCVKYVEGGLIKPTGQKKEKVDYKLLLDERSFERFTRFRAIRKQLAEDEGVPAYAIFTNAELSEIATLPDGRANAPNLFAHQLVHFPGLKRYVFGFASSRLGSSFFASPKKRSKKR